jgi:hypothetical protein
MYFGIAGFILFLLSRFINFYQVAFIGALFEFLWLPMLSVIFIMPIVSFIFWRKENYNTLNFLGNKFLEFSTSNRGQKILLFIVSKGLAGILF